MKFRPLASAKALALRARVLARIRAFFHQRGAMEVTTPVITRSGITDPHIASIAILPEGRGYLRTSPEYFHKRLLASGVGDLYEIGPVFREGEEGRRHHTEFQLLEWYRVGWTYRELMDETVEVVRVAGGGALDDWPVRMMTWAEAFQATLGIDPARLSAQALTRLCHDAPDKLDRSGRFDWLFATRVQPGLAGQQITLIRDFPPEQAALARIRDENPPVAERFELFLGDMELANGYQELTDPALQRKRFLADNRARDRAGIPSMPLDESLLAALAHGLPECAGVALGIDRLLMVLTGSGCIDDCLSFRH